MSNPFYLTRAADLDDNQITKLWVDPSSNLMRMLRPASRLPMLILGGRGSGKTHLLRYFSYPVQRRVYGADKMLSHVRDTGYLGIHTRCMGLYTNRFTAKRMSESQWQALFSFYVELWFGQLILQTALDFIKDANALDSFDENDVVRQLIGLFDDKPSQVIQTLTEYSAFLKHLQRDLDGQVNMASFRQPICPQFLINSGRLTFGIPKIFGESIPCLKEIQFTLFIDEYEHLYVEQQKNINTLLRERENPVSFKIGARLHGMRTYQTWGGDEELKEGSDYELLNLDVDLRSDKFNYQEFATELCLARIKFENSGWPSGWNDQNAALMFAKTFEASLPVEETVRLQLQKRSGDSPWIENVSSALTAHLNVVGKLGINNAQDVVTILERLRFVDNPLIEKTSTFIFYGAWEDQQNLLEAAESIQNSALEYSLKPKPENLHAKKLNHFSEDMRDQMLADLKMDQNVGPKGLLSRYLGVETWIRMSDGIIRNFITTLKHVYDWALFRGEGIYSSSAITLSSQSQGVLDASRWFINDANVLESDRGMVDASVKRIANLLRKLRFSEKPSECSLCRFSVNLNTTSPQARRIIEAAEMWSFFIRDRDRRQRNPGEQLTVLRINPLVAPQYYLPVSARGNIDLSAEDCLAIFASQNDADFKRIEREKVGRCTPPFNKRLIDYDNEPDLLRLSSI